MKFKFWQKESHPSQFFSTEDPLVNNSEYAYDQVNYQEEPQMVQEPIEVKETSYKKVGQWFLCVGVFVLPLFFLPWTTSILELNKQILLLMLAGSTLVLWLLHVVVSGQLSWRFNPVDKYVLGLLAAVLLATIFSVARFKSLFGLVGSSSDSLVTILSLSIFYFGVVNMFEDEDSRIRTFFKCSLFLVLLLGVLQILGFSVFRFFDFSTLRFTAAKTFNTVGSINSLGLIAAVSIPLFYKSKAIFLTKYLNMAGIFLSLLLLIILNWWVLWAIVITGMATMIALDSLNPAYRSENVNNSSSRMSKFLLPMTIIVLGVFLMVINLDLKFLKKDFPLEIAPSFNLSFDIAKSVMKKNVAFGNGPENFSLAFDQFGATKLANTTLYGARFFDSTSQVFDWIIHGGLVVLVSFIFILWSLTVGIFTTKYRKNLEMSHEDTGIFSGMMALMVGMFLYPFNITLMFVAYVMMGLTVMSWKNRKKLFNVEERSSTSLISSLGFIVGLILVLVGSYFGMTIYISDVKYAQALSSQDREKATNFLIEAINWNNQDDRYYKASSQVALSSLSAELNNRADNSVDKTTKIQNYLSSSISLAKRATEISPRESSNWSNLGDAYQNLIGLVDGVDKLAEDAYLKAAELRPGDASFFNKIGNMYLTKSDFYRQLAINGGANAAKFQQEIMPSLINAQENFKKAIEMSDNFGLAIYNLGVVYDRMGKVREAIGQLEKIAPYNSSQPSIAFELGLLYYRNGQKDKAFDQLQKAVLLSSDFSNARWYLGLIYEERLDIPNAIIQMEKILSIDANKENQTVLTKLDELKRGQKTIPPQKVLDQKPL